MGLFDKIKDNAKTISMKAIDATREYVDEEPSQAVVKPAPAASVAAKTEKLPIKSSETPPVALPKPVITKPETPKPVEPKAEKKTKQDTADDAPKPVSIPTDEPTGYVPSYKIDPKKAAALAAAKRAEQPKPRLGTEVKAARQEDPVKQAVLVREHSAALELANKRRLEGNVPLYTTTHLKFRARVFIDRVEYSGTFGKNVIPIDQIAWIRLRHGGTGLMLETNAGKKFVLVIHPKDRLAFAEAVMKMQSLQPKVKKMKDTKTVRLDILEKMTEDMDDLERIANLYKRGIITKQEFELKKQQILNI
jgi:hypothetical protein